MVSGCGPAQASTRDLTPPFWGSLRAPVVNMRAGPGEDYAIRFVYRRQHLPVRVLRVWDAWVLVEDPDGSRGWMLRRFVSSEHTVMVKTRAAVAMHAEADNNSALLWKLEPGLVGKLVGCDAGWCHIDIDRHVGYVRMEALYGAQ